MLLSWPWTHYTPTYKTFHLLAPPRWKLARDNALTRLKIAWTNTKASAHKIALLLARNYLLSLQLFYKHKNAIQGMPVHAHRTMGQADPNTKSINGLRPILTIKGRVNQLCCSPVHPRMYILAKWSTKYYVGCEAGAHNWVRGSTTRTTKDCNIVTNLPATQI